MTNAFLSSIHPALRNISFASLALAATACSNSTALTLTPQGLVRNSPRLARPMSASGYTFYTVDYPNEEPNRVTSIADNQEIVGVYGDGAGKNRYHSYTSTYNSSEPYVAFQDADNPAAASTYLTSIKALPGSLGTVEAGYVTSPDDLRGTWGVINNAGLWTLMNHPHEGKCRMTKLFGMNLNFDAVGFYWDDTSSPSQSPCTTHVQYATKVVPSERFRDYATLKGAHPSANGINKSDWIVGSTDSSDDGHSQGWTTEKQLTFKYWSYDNDSSNSTQMLGLNDSGVIVGTYEDASGNSHGFIVLNVFSNPKYPAWQSIDEPNGNGTNTVISGIDNSGDICGWYTGSDGLIHGFVGIIS